MTTKTLDKLKALSYLSYEKLKSAGKMDRDSLRTLKRMDIPKRFKYFVEVEREARMRVQEGDEEEAYILYSRALEIYRLINDSSDDKFKRSKEGRLYFETAMRITTDFEQVASSLQDRFKLLHPDDLLPTITSSNSHTDELTPAEWSRNHADTVFKTYVKPIELVRYVEKGMNALVLDYRENQGESIEYKNKHGSMKVVHIDQRDVVFGSLLHSIVKALDISIRPILENISHFDVVVLLGDVNDITKKKGSKTVILVEALTTYNFNHKLKRPPVIIEGGYENWKHAYPVYVTETYDIPRFEKSFDEQFTTWIVEARKANELRIYYPSLSTSVGVSGLSSEVQQKPLEPSRHRGRESHIEPSDVLYPSAAPTKPAIASSFIDTNISTLSDLPIHNDKKTVDKYKQISNKTTKIPTIDRSNKPSVAKSLTDQPLQKLTFNDKECRDAHLNKENFAPTDASRSTSPFPQVLGGAGSDPNIPNRRRLPDGTSSAPSHQQPTRPSIPERINRNDPALRQQQQPQQEESTENYFQTSYYLSKTKISQQSASERRKTMSGHTGLVNMGNTCFMNATLQAFFHTPGFSDLFRNGNVASFVNSNGNFGTKGIISGCFSALLDLVWSGDYSAIRPQFFLEVFARRVNEQLADRRQHDAQEFQIFLLDALHEDTNRVDMRRPFEQNYDSSNLLASAQDFFTRSGQFSSSPVNDFFNLTTISELQCKTCNATSVRFEAVTQISVELPSTDNCLKLKDCLKAHFSTTTLDAPWNCPRCKSKQPATRSTKIWKMPAVLIIHLKRFSLSARCFVKNEVEISFDINGLDLSPYIHQKSPLRSAKYNIYAVTNHSGHLNSGHYTSSTINLASAGRDWLHFDDEHCTACSAPSSTSKQAFLLYYKLASPHGHDPNKAMV
uniref:ubiquitinyl hydrolase 1 n=1 Tax=Globodera rostochiensis TaxID=31243 RepID=A0A914HCU9_GLORO